ncbi:MAG: hypothetical protein IT195_05390 [Microthrixaceae bacterium]|nr:hypothetical protein [Microthrixaceae bacterium]
MVSTSGRLLQMLSLLQAAPQRSGPEAPIADASMRALGKVEHLLPPRLRNQVATVRAMTVTVTPQVPSPLAPVMLATLRLDRATIEAPSGHRFVVRPVPGGDIDQFVTSSLAMPEPFALRVRFGAPAAVTNAYPGEAGST